MVKLLGPTVVFKHTSPKAVKVLALNAGEAAVTPFPLTATVTALVTPPPVIVTLPDLGPTV